MAGYSIVRLLVRISSLTTFIVGIILNGILAMLVHHHTPKPMQIYSRILLQTCFTDILLVFATIFAEPISFTIAKGNGRWLNGLVKVENANNRIFGLLVYTIWIFLVYVSLFGSVVQFIYRYLVLNRSKHISSVQYFVMFAAILLLPLIYCIIVGLSYYPAEGNTFLDDPSVADILDLNITADKIVLAGFSTGGRLVTANFYFILICCTLAYALVCVLGWRMHKFVKNRPSGHGTSKYQGKVDEMNRQITLNLIIQAFLPFTIYGPLLFFLVIILFGINVKQLAWIQYYNMLVTVPMFFPPALNPIVTIFTVRHYRKIFLRAIHLVGRVLCCKIAGSLEGTTKTSSFNANGDGTHLPRDAWTQRNK